MFSILFTYIVIFCFHLLYFSNFKYVLRHTAQRISSVNHGGNTTKRFFICLGRSSSQPLDGSIAILYKSSISDHIEHWSNLRQYIFKRLSDDFFFFFFKYSVDIFPIPSKYQTSNGIAVFQWQCLPSISVLPSTACTVFSIFSFLLTSPLSSPQVSLSTISSTSLSGSPLLPFLVVMVCGRWKDLDWCPLVDPIISFYYLYLYVFVLAELSASY